MKRSPIGYRVTADPGIRERFEIDVAGDPLEVLEVVGDEDLVSTPSHRLPYP